jgi:Kef-type K+ transport system membrane component KefB
MGETSIIFGSNPLEASVSLLLLQIIIIVVLCRCLSYVLRYFHQPPVIAEVIGGLILGPTALGRLYVFKEIIFSKSSLSYLKLVADLGLGIFG